MKIYDYYTIIEKRSNNNAWNDYYTIKRIDKCKDDFFTDIKIFFLRLKQWVIASLTDALCWWWWEPCPSKSGGMSLLFSVVETYFLYSVAGAKL